MASCPVLGIPLIRTEVGIAQQVPTEYFLQHIIPLLHPEINLRKVLTKLRRTGKKSRCSLTKQGRWRGFAEDPADIGRGREATFTRFGDMVNAIVRAGAPEGSSYLSLVHTLGDIPPTDPDGCYYPDAYLAPHGSSSDEPSWDGMSVLRWYEMNDDDDDIERVRTVVC